MTMTLRFSHLFAGLMLLLALALPAWAQQPVAVPQLSTQVTDLTSTLTPGQVQALTDKLAEVTRRKGAQIAILIVPTTGADSIEQYATRAFDQWRLGRKGVDDGVLLLVAKNDHTVRIEAGRGLEGAIPDITAGRIIREQIVPAFRQGDYAGGLGTAVDSLIGLINGEALPPPPPESDSSGDGLPTDFPQVFMMAIIAGIVIRFVLRGVGLPTPLPPVGSALAAGGIGWAVSGIAFLGMFCAVGALVFGGFGSSLGGMGGGSFSSRRGSGGFGGGFGGGGFGGGGSSGGGFSGGGGSSGGGGASGSW